MLSPVVLGIDFGGTKIALAAADAADGSRLGSATVPTLADEGAQAGLARAVHAARALLERVAPGRALAAVGCSTIGIPGAEGVELAPNIPGWADLALARELGAAFPDAVIRLATDVKAAGRVEARQGALRGAEPGIYLNLGTGLAVAIIANGEVVAGRNGASGEIGYNLRTVADVGLPPGGRELLEDTVSGKALLTRAMAVMPQADGAQDVFAGADTDPRLAALLGEFTAELAFHLVNLTIAVDPERIAVGGGMVRSWAALHGPLRRALDAAVPYPPELVRAAFPFDAPLLGALALGLEAARERAGASATAAAPLENSTAADTAVV